MNRWRLPQAAWLGLVLSVGAAAFGHSGLLLRLPAPPAKGAIEPTAPAGIAAGTIPTAPIAGPLRQSISLA